jgi:hypothetical protein
MGDPSRVGTALGAAGESVMSLYAIAHLLKSRDLGPARLGPAIEANRTRALRLEPELRQLFELLRATTADSPELGVALSLLEPHAMALAASLAQAFGQPASARLGAKERLELERRAAELGSELEGVRAMLALVFAAAESRPVDLELGSVMDGGSSLEPTFVSHKAEVRVRLDADRSFTGDPRVLWPLIEAAFRELAGQGEELLLCAGSDVAGLVRVQITAGPPAAPKAANGTMKLALGSPIRVEREVVRAVARHVGIRYEVVEAEHAVTIALG